LDLCACTIQNQVQFSVFLEHQPALRTLVLQQMAIETGLLVFASIGTNHRLKAITLNLCDYARECLNPLKTCTSLEHVTIIGDDRATEITRDFVNRGTPQLSIINLELEIASSLEWENTNWIRFIPSAFPNLVSLQLDKLKCLQACTIRSLFNLTKLRELGLRNCEIPFGVFTPDLANLPAFHRKSSLVYCNGFEMPCTLNPYNSSAHSFRNRAIRVTWHKRHRRHHRSGRLHGKLDLA